MANLFGKRWTRKQLLERIGDPAQIATVRPHELTDGRAKGVSAIEFSTGSGFRFTVLPDRGLDIGPAEHAGKSLCWHSCTGVVSPNFDQPEGMEWLHGFMGGLMLGTGARRWSPGVAKRPDEGEFRAQFRSDGRQIEPERISVRRESR